MMAYKGLVLQHHLISMKIRDSTVRAESWKEPGFLVTIGSSHTSPVLHTFVFLVHKQEINLS